MSGPGSTADELYRATMQGRTPDGEITTVIISRQGTGTAARTWLTLQSSWRGTVVLSDRQIGELVAHLLVTDGMQR